MKKSKRRVAPQAPPFIKSGDVLLVNTTNPNKLRTLSREAHKHGVRVISLQAILPKQYSPPAETGTSINDNADIKLAALFDLVKRFDQPFLNLLIAREMGYLTLTNEEALMHDLHQNLKGLSAAEALTLLQDEHHKGTFHIQYPMENLAAGELPQDYVSGLSAVSFADQDLADVAAILPQSSRQRPEPENWRHIEKLFNDTNVHFVADDSRLYFQKKRKADKEAQPITFGDISLKIIEIAKKKPEQAAALSAEWDRIRYSTANFIVFERASNDLVNELKERHGTYPVLDKNGGIDPDKKDRIKTTLQTEIARHRRAVSPFAPLAELDTLLSELDNEPFPGTVGSDVYKTGFEDVWLFLQKLYPNLKKVTSESTLRIVSAVVDADGNYSVSMDPIKIDGKWTGRVLKKPRRREAIDQVITTPGKKTHAKQPRKSVAAHLRENTRALTSAREAVIGTVIKDKGDSSALLPISHKDVPISILGLETLGERIDAIKAALSDTNCAYIDLVQAHQTMSPIERAKLFNAAQIVVLIEPGETSSQAQKDAFRQLFLSYTINSEIRSANSKLRLIVLTPDSLAGSTFRRLADFRMSALGKGFSGSVMTDINEATIVKVYTIPCAATKNPTALGRKIKEKIAAIQNEASGVLAPALLDAREYPRNRSDLLDASFFADTAQAAATIDASLHLHFMPIAVRLYGSASNLNLPLLYDAAVFNDAMKYAIEALDVEGAKPVPLWVDGAGNGSVMSVNARTSSLIKIGNHRFELSGSSSSLTELIKSEGGGYATGDNSDISLEIIARGRDLHQHFALLETALSIPVFYPGGPGTVLEFDDVLVEFCNTFEQNAKCPLIVYDPDGWFTQRLQKLYPNELDEIVVFISERDPEMVQQQVTEYLSAHVLPHNDDQYRLPRFNPITLIKKAALNYCSIDEQQKPFDRQSHMADMANQLLPVINAMSRQAYVK